MWLLAWEFLLFSSVLHFSYASSFRPLLLRLCSNRCAEALLTHQSRRLMGRLDFFFFGPTLLLSIHTLLFLPSSSVSSSYFILVVPMRACLGKHSCMRSHFYSHTEWYLFFHKMRWASRSKRVTCQKLTIITTIIMIIKGVDHWATYLNQLMLICTSYYKLTKWKH